MLIWHKKSQRLVAKEDDLMVQQVEARGISDKKKRVQGNKTMWMHPSPTIKNSNITS